MIEPERQPDPVAQLLRRAVELDESERVESRSAFLRRVERELEAPSTSRRAVRYVAPLALAAVVLLFFVFRSPEQGAGYVVRGATNEGGYIRAAEDRPAEITFADRTRIKASAGARLRVSEQDAQPGARVSVERGRLEAEVTHAGRSNWQFVAGPFQVRVTGTRFALVWDAESEQLEVVLHEGSVDVEGHAGSGVVSMRAGQRFVGDARRKTMLVSDLAAPAASLSAAPPPAAPESAAGADSAGTPSVPAPAPSAKPSWAKLVSRGEFQRVVDEAGARGVKECLAACDPSELSALADAARYVGRSDLAEQVLLALRQRDSQGSGSRAAFLLGRLHESKGDAVRAKSWYETSLREAPSGAFAAESLAGKMRAVKSAEGRAAARPIAQEYLRRYPAGVHAATARQLVDGP